MSRRGTRHDPDEDDRHDLLWDFDNDDVSFDDATGHSVPWTFARQGSYPSRSRSPTAPARSALATRTVNVANTLPLATFTS